MSGPCSGTSRRSPRPVAVILTIGRALAGGGLPGRRSPAWPIVVVGYNHSGDAAAVERDLAPFRSGPEPVSQFGRQPAVPRGPERERPRDGLGPSVVHRWAATRTIIRPATLDALVDHAARAPEGSSFSVTVLGGAIGRVPDAATAFPGRNVRFDLSADAEWDDPALDETYRDWVRQAMAIVEPDTVTGRYVNEVSETGPGVSRTIFGDVRLARLAGLKRAWNPDNVFRLNHNIAP